MTGTRGIPLIPSEKRFQEITNLFTLLITDLDLAYHKGIGISLLIHFQLPEAFCHLLRPFSSLSA